VKGITFVERGKAAFVEEPDPVCRADTVLLKTLYSGLSNGTERSFLMSLHYGWEAPYPKRIGYQHVSEVIECGSEITNFRAGDVVFTATFPGHVPCHLARESDLIIKLPAGFDRVAAAQLAVACVSWHDAMRGHVGPTDNVLVVGAGLIGQFAAQACRAMGARVAVAGHHDDRLALAAELGADETLNTNDDGAMDRLQELAPFSVVMETTGADVLDWIIGAPGKAMPCMVGWRSRVVMIGGRREVNYSYLRAGGNQVALLHTGHFKQVDLEQVVRLAAKGAITIRPLIRDVVPASEAPRIYDTLANEPSKLLGVVFDWT
jgi:2-desacetyl-2-hydroxyethyl bacteriochlorophyllide A dehydrogenase